jgi:SPP1 gp7 family putative phage head morphogenesis protein
MKRKMCQKITAKMIQETAAFLVFVKKANPEVVAAQLRLEKRLNGLFQKVAREIDNQIANPRALTNAQTLSAPVNAARDEFAIIINEELKRSVTLPQSVVARLEEQGAQSANKMLTRMQNKITKIIETAQTEGTGLSDVQKKLAGTFKTLSEGEVKTIARNEMNLASAISEQNNFLEQGVQYQQWSAILDDVTRSSHEDLDGEIIRIGDTFSNGLRYPQDRNGDIEEWINCRCDALPFIPPRGYYPPPGQEQFREEDLLSIN